MCKEKKKRVKSVAVNLREGHPEAEKIKNEKQMKSTWLGWEVEMFSMNRR